MKDIDLRNHVLKVRQNFTEMGLDTPKTKSSKRDVSIPRHLAGEIKEYIKRMFEPAGKDLLFSGITVNTIRSRFRTYQERAGIKPRIRLHDLRHSHASLLIHAGFTPDVVADRLGHENAQMVLAIYGHMYPQKRAEVVGTLDKLYAESPRLQL